MQPDSSNGSDLSEDLHRLSFGVERSILYHNCRRDFLQRLAKLCALVTVVAGAGTFLAVVASGPKWLQLTLPVVVTLISTTDLIFDFRGTSGEHKALSARFRGLLHDIEANQSPAHGDIATYYDRRRAIENDAPGVMKMLDVLCHNDLIRSKGHDASEFVNLTWTQKLFAHWFNVGSVPAKRGSA